MVRGGPVYRMLFQLLSNAFQNAVNGSLSGLGFGGDLEEIVPVEPEFQHSAVERRQPAHDVLDFVNERYRLDRRGFACLQVGLEAEQAFLRAELAFVPDRTSVGSVPLDLVV